MRIFWLARWRAGTRLGRGGTHNVSQSYRVHTCPLANAATAALPVKVPPAPAAASHPCEASAMLTKQHTPPQPQPWTASQQLVLHGWTRGCVAEGRFDGGVMKQRAGGKPLRQWRAILGICSSLYNVTKWLLCIYVHTRQKAPEPFSTRKLSCRGRGQYWGGGPPGKPP